MIKDVDFNKHLMVSSINNQLPTVEFIGDDPVECEYCRVPGDGVKCKMCGAIMPTPSLFSRNGLLLMGETTCDDLQSAFRLMEMRYGG